MDRPKILYLFNASVIFDDNFYSRESSKKLTKTRRIIYTALMGEIKLRASLEPKYYQKISVQLLTIKIHFLILFGISSTFVK